MRYFLLTILLSSQITSAALPQEVREDFPEYIQKTCTPSLEYNLDMPIFNKKDGDKIITNATTVQYQKRINCIFNDAMTQMVNDNNDKFTPILQEVDSPEKFKDIDFNKTSSCEFTLEQIQQKQADHGFKTRCEFAEGDSVIEEFYSACRVTETVLNEFCAYEEFLALKYEDGLGRADESISQDKLSKKQEVALFSFDAQEQFIKSESKKSQKILVIMIRRYKEFEFSYKMHLWYISMQEHLRYTQKLMTTLRTAVERWPEKFINASSANCDQINYTSTGCGN